MVLNISLGIVTILMGASLILGRRNIPPIMHAGLKVIFGEPVADDHALRFTPRVVVVVGVAWILMGVLSIFHDLIW